MIKPVELTNIEGTVITANAYKDADAIITILSEGRKLTFKACGAMKPTSKLHLATYIYSDVVLEISGYKDHPEIKGVKLKKNRTDIYEDLKFMTALGIVQEIITNLVTEEDFIDDAYILEVSSPGLGRPLKKDKDFERSLGEDVEIKLYRMKDGTKDYRGFLKSYNKEEIVIEDNDEEITFKRSEIALVRLALDF